MRRRESYLNAGTLGVGNAVARAKAWGLQRNWWEWDDESATASALDGARKAGMGVGLKMNGAGATVAEAMSTALAGHGFGPSTTPSSCGAAFDPEPFHPSDVLELLHRWRELRPRRWTSLWLPPWQAGLFSRELVAAINGDANLELAVELYMTYRDEQGALDDLYPASFRALDELAAIGVDRSKLQAFLPVKGSSVGVEIPYGWDGYLWTLDALPAEPQAPL